MIDKYWSLAEKLLKKGFWLYLFSFIIAPIWYIIKIIISGEISVSELGILYGIISLVTLLSSFNDLGMSESLLHFIPKYATEKKYNKVQALLIYAFLAQAISWLIIASIFYFWANYIATNYFESKDAIQSLKIFAFFFIWINIFQIIEKFFSAIQNTFYSKIVELVRMWFILMSVFFIFFSDLWSLINYSYSWLIWLYVWVLFAISLFYKKYYNKYFKWIKIIWSKKLFKKVFSYALIVFLWAQASSILSQMDMQMIIYLLDTTQAWYYSNYMSIITIPFMIIWPIFAFLFPLFSQLHAQRKYEKIKLVKKIMQKNFIAVALAFNILFFIFAETIAYILFGEKYTTSWHILQYSILFLVFNFLLQINFNIFAWIWRIKERLKIISIALVFNFVLNIILIKQMWVYWAALATSLGWVLIWLLSEIKLWKKYFSHFDYRYLTKNIIFLWLLWGVCYYYINPVFEWLSRWESFWVMAIIWIIWFTLFSAINLKDFKGFILEIKKLKWKKI